MRIAFITRSTLYAIPGGDTVQVQGSVYYLNEMGIKATIHLTHEIIDYSGYDVFHFSNITRPADILFHINQTAKPFLVAPIFIDYTEYDRYHRQGLPGFILRQFPAGSNEYIKTIGRWLFGKDTLRSREYIWKGQYKSIREILQRAAVVLPGTEKEYRQLKDVYGIETRYRIVPNGIDTGVFRPDEKIVKDDKLILCAARIEGIKNQLNLIRALNDTNYTLLLVGSPAPNQKKYFEACKKIAGKNIIFRERVTQEALAGYYKKAKVHVLPSWFETCGLSSLEAAAMGCNVVITDKGYTREYFGNDAFYCNPADPASIFNAIEQAAQSENKRELQEKIMNSYTWRQAAVTTLDVCKTIMP